MTGQPLDRVVIVGASVAGITAAETLRRRGYAGRISLVGEETHLPYDRPPLSKQILTGTWEVERLTFRNEAAVDRLQLDRHLATRAQALDLSDRKVVLDDGTDLSFDGLIIATGVTPRRLPSERGLSGVHVLRTVEDALAIRASWTPGARLVVIGAGFLGCEVAAAARKSGVRVAIVDPQPEPMMRQLGAEISQHVADLHREHGVEVRCGVGMTGFVGEGHVTGVSLATGEVIPADSVVVAIGAVPATAWLVGSGLNVSDGIVCDSTCQAAPGVYAAGDVARWWHDSLGTYMRVEHRLNATEQAIAAANNLLGDATPFTPVPYFWADQYDTRIQGFGTFSSNAAVAVVRGELSSRRFVAHYITNGLITGVLAWNMPKELRAELARIGDSVERVGP